MSILLLWCALCGFNTIANACNVPADLVPASSYVLKNADVIIRVTAIEFIENEGVKFKVEEVLRGEGVPSTLFFRGHLSDRDDFNQRPVPYDHVRSAGGGPCYAYEYKRGAEFLLFLKRDGDKLNPYWKPLAPTNEQLHPEKDAWLEWVRKNLEPENKKEARVEIIYLWLHDLIANAI
jgi:hypothetical protein